MHCRKIQTFQIFEGLLYRNKKQFLHIDSYFLYILHMLMLEH